MMSVKNMQHSVIEMNGERIEVKNGVPYVNGVKVGEGKLGHSDSMLVTCTLLGFIIGVISVLFIS